MYGKTQWTNREVKLADMLNKIIIPINFLEKWPPSCLSIQFATIQVIHYKPPTIDSEHVESQGQQLDNNDFRNWPDAFVNQVSIQIAKQVPKFDEEQQIQQKNSFLDKASIVTGRSLEANNSTTNKTLAKKTNNSNQIVISAHPMQKKLADDLRSNLQKENYEVWVSTDFLDSVSPSNTIVSIDYPETPDSMASLSTISEITENNSSRVASSTTENEEKKSSTDKLCDNDNFPKICNGHSKTASTLISNTTITALNSTKAITNINNSLVKRPTSLPITKTDNPYFQIEKRSIRRLPSQISEISVSNNTLTPEKMQRLTQFQDKVANSKLVIILISDAYFRSRTSKVGNY